MTANEKEAVKNHFFTDLFLTFGAGQPLFRFLTSLKAWNLIAWLLIICGSFAWLLFLIWRP